MSIGSLYYSGQTAAIQIMRVGLLPAQALNAVPNVLRNYTTAPLDIDSSTSILPIEPQLGTATFTEELDSEDESEALYIQKLKFRVAGTRNELQQALAPLELGRHIVLVKHRAYTRIAGLPNGMTFQLDIDTGTAAVGGIGVKLENRTTMKSVRTSYEAI